MTTTTTSVINLGPRKGRSTAGRQATTVSLIVAAALLIVGLFLPLLVSQNYWMTVLVDAALLAIVAVSIGFLYRNLGLISLGQTAFYGTSAYVMTILNVHVGWSLTMSAVVGFLAGVVVAMLIGFLVMRAKGIAFLMLTMALGLAIYHFVLMEWMRPITGTYDGLILMPDPEDSFFGLSTRDMMNDRIFWPIVWILLVLITVLLWWVGQSRFGTVLHGIRENEERMRFSGYDTLKPRFFAFVIAGAVASLAGVLTVANSGLVTDQSLSFLTTSHTLVATIVGGMSMVLGPIVGAFVFTFMQSWFSSSGGMEFFIGLVLVVVLAFMRGGIVGGVAVVISKLRKRGAVDEKGDE